MVGSHNGAASMTALQRTLSDGAGVGTMATFNVVVTEETHYVVEAETEDEAIELATGATEDTEGAVQMVDSDTHNITAWEA